MLTETINDLKFKKQQESLYQECRSDCELIYGMTQDDYLIHFYANHTSKRAFYFLTNHVSHKRIIIPVNFTEEIKEFDNVDKEPLKALSRGNPIVTAAHNFNHLQLFRLYKHISTTRQIAHIDIDTSTIKNLNLSNPEFSKMFFDMIASSLRSLPLNLYDLTCEKNENNYSKAVLILA